MNRSAKLTRPRARPIGGIKMSLTKDVTMAPKAAPMTTATARSTTLPRIKNALKSFSMGVSSCRPSSLHPVLDLGNGGTGTLLVELATGGAAHADGPDGLVTRLDGHPAHRVGDVGQRRLRDRGRGILAHAVGHGLGAVLLAGEGEGGCGVGLVEGVVEGVDRCPVATQHGL